MQNQFAVHCLEVKQPCAVLLYRFFSRLGPFKRFSKLSKLYFFVLIYLHVALNNGLPNCGIVEVGVHNRENLKIKKIIGINIGIALPMFGYRLENLTYKNKEKKWQCTECSGILQLFFTVKEGRRMKRKYAAVKC